MFVVLEVTVGHGDLVEVRKERTYEVVRGLSVIHGRHVGPEEMMMALRTRRPSLSADSLPHFPEIFPAIFFLLVSFCLPLVIT